MEPAVGDLLSKQAITEVLYTYCRALDRMDRELALSVWHEDGTADYGAMYQGTGPGFIDWVWRAHAGFERHSHQVTNILIRPNGQKATSESYVTVALRAAQSEMVGRGRYLDRWSFREGRWAIDHRRYVHDLEIVHDLPPDTALLPPESRRDRQDPSYELMGEGSELR